MRARPPSQQPIQEALNRIFNEGHQSKEVIRQKRFNTKEVWERQFSIESQPSRDSSNGRYKEPRTTQIQFNLKRN